MIEQLAAWQGKKTRIPFDMFALERSADEARRADKLRHIYHRGQDLAWDGRAVLAELIAKHGGIDVPPEKARPLSKVFEVILWGELAAHPWLEGLGPAPEVFEAHYWEIKRAPAGFRVLASSELCGVQALAHEHLPLFGTQFHPEAYDDAHPAGRDLLQNFFRLAGI